MSWDSLGWLHSSPECPRGCCPRDSRGRSHILLLPGFHSLAHTLTCPVCTPHVPTHTQGSQSRVRSTMGPGVSGSPSTRDLSAARPPPHQADGRAVSWEAHLFRHKCPGFRPFYPHADCGTEGASAAHAGGSGSMRRGGMVLLDETHPLRCPCLPTSVPQDHLFKMQT